MLPLRKVKRLLRRPFETLVAALALGVIPLLPRIGVRALAALLGAAGHAAGGRLRRDGVANLALAFPSMPPEERSRILRSCYRNYARMILDVFWFSRFTEARIRRWVVKDESFSRIRTSDPQVILTAHMGNWELAGMTVAGDGRRLLSVAATLDNALVNRLFIGIREKTGQAIIPQQGAILKLARGLRDGAKWAILLDQNTEPRHGGIFVPFFGLPVPVSAAPAALARKMGVQILLAFCLPEPGGRYRMFFPGTLTVEKGQTDEASVADLTARMTAAVEAVIRQHPHCWLWMYKRWKFKPAPDAPGPWPFYARPMSEAEQAQG